MDILQAGTRLQTILDLLLPTHSRISVQLAVERSKIDAYGFDFELNGSETQLETWLLQKKKSGASYPLAFPVESLVSAYVQPETVIGGHLTKCSLVFEKASPLSFLSFRMHSVFPVRLASLLYESDISGFSEAKKVNLDMIHLQQSNETITLLFGHRFLPNDSHLFWRKTTLPETPIICHKKRKTFLWSYCHPMKA